MQYRAEREPEEEKKALFHRSLEHLKDRRKQCEVPTGGRCIVHGTAQNENS